MIASVRKIALGVLRRIAPATVMLAPLMTPSAASAQPTPGPTDLACYSLGPVFPYAATVDTFNNGDTVSFVADLSKLTTLAGVTCYVWVCPNQIWAFGLPLIDARGGPQVNTFFAGSATFHIFPLINSAFLPFDAGEDIGIGYDIIIDRDNSGTLSIGDYIDGPGPEGGFYKIRDLSTANAATPVSQLDVFLPVGRTEPGFEGERWYYPSDIASRGQIPLVVISHGNGHDYTWYDYLGQFLASYGYIVVSHANNTAPLVLAASQAVFDHTNSVIALQATVGGGVLNGHIDSHRIVWIGHGRGGEGVAQAYDRLVGFEEIFSPTGGFEQVVFAPDIKVISSIAPTDFQGTGISDPHSATYHLIYGSADGVILGVPFNDDVNPFNLFERATDRRNATYIHGADHNDFNCCGFNDFVGCAGTEIGRPTAQAIAKGEWLALIKHYLHGNIPCKEVLWRQYENLHPIGVSPTVTVDREFKDTATARFVIDDFQTNPALNLSSSGGSVVWSVTNLFEGLMNDEDKDFAFAQTDPMNGMTRARPTDSTRGVVFDYDDTLASWVVIYEVVPAGRNTKPFTYLSFRACQQTGHHNTIYGGLGDQDFQVMLVDGDLNSSAVDVGAYFGSVEEPYCREGGLIPGDPWDPAGWQNEFETCRIRLSDFRADGRTLDLSDIRYVYFLFGADFGHALGRIALDDIEWVRKYVEAAPRDRSRRPP